MIISIKRLYHFKPYYGIIKSATYNYDGKTAFRNLASLSIEL